jgi:hypothetical protein
MRRGLILLALAVAALATALARSAVGFDALAFLHRPRDHLFEDPAHLLYPALVQGAAALGSALGLEPVLAASLLSALALAGAAATLAVLTRKAGAPPAVALGTGLLFALGASALREATSIEAYHPALALLGGSLVLALRVRSFAGAIATILLLVLASTMHAAALLGGFALARSLLANPHLPRRSALMALGASLATAGLALASGFGVQVLELVETARAFAAAAPEAGRVLAPASRLGRFLLENATGAALVAASALLLLLHPRHRAVVLETALPGAYLAAPFLSAFLVLGTPMLGLLLPASFGLALLGAPSLARLGPGILVPALLVLQAALTLPTAIREARAPDPLREEAEALLAAAPPDAVFLAGPVAWHLRHLGAARVLSIDELFHEARARSRREPEAREVLIPALAHYADRPILLGSACAPRLVQQVARSAGSEERAARTLSALLLLGRDPVAAPSLPAGRWSLLLLTPDFGAR